MVPGWVLLVFSAPCSGESSHTDEASNFNLPAAGLGVRYVLSQKDQISLSFDLSLGRNGGQFYFGVGEAF